MKFSRSKLAFAALPLSVLLGLFAACSAKDDDKEAVPEATPPAAAKNLPLTLNLKADCKGKPCF